MANDRSDPWPTITWMGILCGIAFGAVIVMLLRRRDEQHQLRLPVAIDDSDDYPLFNMPLAPPRASSLSSATLTKASPIARTVTVTENRPTFLFRAIGTTDWTVWVRVVGPPGAFATFTISGSTADMLVLPAGGHHQMMIPRYQSLFAQGDMADVQVAISGGPGREG